MKKLMFIFTLLLFLMGCDNNEGPFDIRMENGKQILYSNDKPAKGWVQMTWTNGMNGISSVVSKIYYEDGKPAGNFDLYNRRGELVANGEGTWENGLFKGTIFEPFMEAKASGIFSINTNFLISYSGEFNEIELGYRTLIDGSYDSRIYILSKKNNVLDGTFRKDYTNGEMEKEAFYVNGKLEGEYRENWSNGKPKIRANFKDGELVGEEIRYFENGNIDKSYFYDEKTKTVKDYSYNNQINSITKYSKDSGEILSLSYFHYNQDISSFLKNVYYTKYDSYIDEENRYSSGLFDKIEKLYFFSKNNPQDKKLVAERGEKHYYKSDISYYKEFIYPKGKDGKEKQTMIYLEEKNNGKMSGEYLHSTVVEGIEVNGVKKSAWIPEIQLYYIEGKLKAERLYEYMGDNKIKVITRSVKFDNDRKEYVSKSEEVVDYYDIYSYAENNSLSKYYDYETEPKMSINRELTKAIKRIDDQWSLLN